jgi:general stress protein YciG
VLDFHDLVSSANNGDQEDWNNDGEREDNVGRDGGHLSSLGGIISLDELHDREEGKIEVGEHVVSDVHVELVLSKAVVEEHTDSGSLSKGFGEHKDYNVGNDDEAEAKHDQEQGLTKLGNTEPIVIVVNIEVIILHVQQQEWLVGQNQVRYQEWLECIIQVWDHLEVVQRDESAQLHVLNQGPQRKETDLSVKQDEELEPDDTAEIPEHLLRHVSEPGHNWISEIKLQVNSLFDIDLFSVLG